MNSSRDRSSFLFDFYVHFRGYLTDGPRGTDRTEKDKNNSEFPIRIVIQRPRTRRVALSSPFTLVRGGCVQLKSSRLFSPPAGIVMPPIRTLDLVPTSGLIFRLTMLEMSFFVC